jgi:hypothetical protein
LKETNNILQSFDPVSLAELNTTMLNDRIETKFIFNIALLPAILQKLPTHYNILSIDDTRIHKVDSLYFDAEDHQLYLLHQNGKMNRYKVRYRKYPDSFMSYFELKFKNNKGRIIKNRIAQKDIKNEIKNESASFLSMKTGLDPEKLFPSLWVHYHRISLIHKFSKERTTIDIKTDFKFNSTSFSKTSLVIAEVKQEKFAPSPFFKVMKELHLQPCNMSKYCYGLISLNLLGDLKKNNFKPLLLNINKLCNE